VQTARPHILFADQLFPEKLALPLIQRYRHILQKPNPLRGG
jgi:hypothetical protein